MSIAKLREKYHQRIRTEIVRVRGTEDRRRYPNFADGGSKSSVETSWALVKRLGWSVPEGDIKPQSVGRLFERATKDFLEEAFELVNHLRPGRWYYSVETAISDFAQYEHLAHLERLVGDDKGLRAALGGDYIVKPDIAIGRWPVSDEEINLRGKVVNARHALAQLTPFREVNRADLHPILHASISCKWTIRSDRAQNTRTEALNLIRHRKGHLSHICAVTAEPLPTRIATLALGTGDLDCVYHLALPELREAIEAIQREDQLDMLVMLIEGHRLRDISDLPFDLAA